MSAQIEIVSAQIGCRATGRSRGFGRLERRLDDAGDARGDLVLKLEDVFQRIYPEPAEGDLAFVHQVAAIHNN
jgi:hypothetical protein